MTAPDRLLLFHTEPYAYLAAELGMHADYDPGSIERRRFPDGERYLRIIDESWGRDVVLLGGTPTDSACLELYDLGCAISRSGARSLTIVIPYFGYATMERAVRPGEVVTAKTRARLISAIPPCEAGTRILLFDLHTDGIEFYFSDAHVTHHLYGEPIIVEAVSSMMGAPDYVLGAVDAGRAKWVQRLASLLGVSPAFVYKRRDADTGGVSVTGVNADVAGRRVVLYDDMIRTGGSLIQAAEAYRAAGATEVHAVASHLVLPPGALDKLRQGGALTSVSGTNSHPNSQQLTSWNERGVISVAPLLHDAILRADRRASPRQ